MRSMVDQKHSVRSPRPRRSAVWLRLTVQRSLQLFVMRLPARAIARRVACGALALMCMLPDGASAQIRASELGTMSQIIDGTKVSVTYSRPRARGRSPLFGTSVAHWGEVWTPGANYATVLELSKDVTINGRAVPKGKYSVWMVLRERGDWTTILDPFYRIFHMDPPDSSSRQIRIPTPIDQAPFMDVLTWSMPELSASGGTLAMQWGTTRANLKLTVTPTLEVTMPEVDARPYVGQYEYRLVKPTPGSSGVSTFFVTYENKTLKGRWEPEDSYMKTFALIRVGPDIFAPGLYDKSGAIYEVLRPDMMFTFKRVAGQPITFSVRLDTDELEATATKKP
jgi:Protein of unknown function (DUF2911)